MGKTKIADAAFYTYKQCVNLAANGKLIPNKDIYISQFTPQLLRTAGLENLPLYISSSHIQSVLSPFNDGKHLHEIDKNILLNIQDYLNDPAIVFASDNQQQYSAVSVVLDARDKDAQPIMCCIHAPGDINGTPVNYISSIYGKRPVGMQNQIQNALDNNNVLYVNKDKCKSLLILPDQINTISYESIKFRKKQQSLGREVNDDYYKKCNFDVGR